MPDLNSFETAFIALLISVVVITLGVRMFADPLIDFLKTLIPEAYIPWLGGLIVVVSIVALIKYFRR